jgi:hypothetical protein
LLLSVLNGYDRQGNFPYLQNRFERLPMGFVYLSVYSYSFYNWALLMSFNASALGLFLLRLAFAFTVTLTSLLFTSFTLSQYLILSSAVAILSATCLYAWLWVIGSNSPIAALLYRISFSQQSISACISSSLICRGTAFVFFISIVWVSGYNKHRSLLQENPTYPPFPHSHGWLLVFHTPPPVALCVLLPAFRCNA